MRIITVALVAIALPTLLGGQVNRPAKRSLDDARRELRLADEHFAQAAEQNLLSAYRSVVASGVVFLEPGEQIMQGSEQAIAALVRADASGSSTGTWHPVRVDVSDDMASGYTYGFGSVTIPAHDTAKAVTIANKYISYWRRD